MSPSATGGPPHTRAASGNGGPTTTKTDMKAYGVDGGKNSNKIWPHHDDLVSVAPSVDINSPMGTVLKEALQLAKAADTSLDFRRPDIALQEYVKASIIAAEMIPRHKDFPNLKADRGELHRMYISLTKRIQAQDQKFTEVKKMIKENNAIHGTQPKIKISGNVEQEPAPNGRGNGQVRYPSNETNGNDSPRKKPPPPIQPKPNALHGKSIQTIPSELSSTHATDLATRFARLRSTEPQVQDPRIRTRPIAVPIPTNSGSPLPLSPNSGHSSIARPTGPRELPSVPKTLPGSGKITVNIDLPALPKAPDAVYSPARGAENSATANLPSSHRANSYSGSGKHFAAPPISTVGPTPFHVQKPDYFSPAHTVTFNGITRDSSNRRESSLPTTSTITAEDLMTYLRKGSQGLQVLLVDLRSREDFDNGHIMSQSVICVEPITLRHGISGQELEDSMVIAPDIEQRLFEQRNSFDLVVVYDQSSKSLKTGGLNTKLLDFTTAVYDFGYDKKLKHHPVLLHGGLDAWIDLLGPSSLETSSTGSALVATAPNGAKRARPVNSIPMARDSRGVFMARNNKYKSRPLSKEEENKWVSALQQENESEKGGPSSDELIYARTTEDFFRRYPELPSIQESMVSPVLKPSVHPIEAELARTTPNPPARPPPALPRQRSSGISERQTMVNYAHSVSPPESITNHQKPPGLTGLYNPGNLCYLNTVVQGLSCTPLFRNLQIIPVRAKASENGGTPPQLMAKCVKNLMSHLWSGQWDYVNPKTFRAYVNAVHAPLVPNRPQDAFGGLARQHDSSEFLRFIFEILDDELNPTRCDPGRFVEDAEYYRHLYQDFHTIEEAAEEFRSLVIPHQTSVLAQNMTVISVNILTCDSCHRETRKFVADVGAWLLKPPRSPNPITLMALIRGEIGQETGYVGTERQSQQPPRECEFCDNDSRAAGTAPRRHPYRFKDWLAVLPESFVIMLGREVNEYEGDRLKYYKISTPVTFTERIDLNETRPTVKDRGDRIYEVYAVAIHRGSNIQAGHYYLIGRDPSVPGSPWYKYNDSRVTRSKFADTQNLAHEEVVHYIFVQKSKRP